MVQQYLFCNPGDNSCLNTCAAFLEIVIQHSPDNAYLKFCAIDVYHRLGALTRSWDIFETIGIKHIQLDSCTFTILPYLLEGGLYNEAVQLCNAMLRFQASTARDCGDYAGRAMHGGTLSKADEFLVFQRKKVNDSLAILDAKGIILDAAPLLATAVPRKKFDEDPLMKGEFGVHQGIVGGESDMERTKQMIVESHNPYAALSLISFQDEVASTTERLADNRDLSIFSYQLLNKTTPPSRDDLVKDARRRGHIHGLLIRAALFVDSAKGPKKGKVVKPSAELESRTNSLLSCIAAAEEDINDLTRDEASKCLLRATFELGRVAAAINAGLPDPDGDSMEQREERACGRLDNKVLVLLKEARSSLKGSLNVTCSYLASCVTPIFAVFQVTANLCDLYGWGKRKRRTKRCAGCLADVAVEIGLFLRDLKKPLER